MADDVPQSVALSDFKERQALSIERPGAAMRGPLVRGTLTALDRKWKFDDGPDLPGGQFFAFQYNPASLTFRREISIGAIDTPGSDTPITYFQSAKPDSFRFTLRMEAKTYEYKSQLVRNWDQGVMPHLAALLSLTYSEEALGRVPLQTTAITYPRRPPKLLLALGPFIQAPVYISQLEYTIEEWNNKMIPNRARADVTMVTRGETGLMDVFLKNVDRWALENGPSLDPGAWPSGAPTVRPL